MRFWGDLVTSQCSGALGGVALSSPGLRGATDRSYRMQEERDVSKGKVTQNET